MQSREKKYQSDYAYLAQAERIIDNDIPWKDIESMRKVITTYTDMQSELRDRDVEDEDIETLDDLIKILEGEINNYVVK